MIGRISGYNKCKLESLTIFKVVFFYAGNCTSENTISSSWTPPSVDSWTKFGFAAYSLVYFSLLLQPNHGRRQLNIWTKPDV